MIQKIKQITHKISKFLKEYQISFVLLIVLAALGLSGYNTYLIKINKSGINTTVAQTAKKLTEADVAQMIAMGAPVLGNADAKVTVVEFADFQCPFCGRYFKEVLPEIKEKFIDTGKVKFVFMNFAFLGQESKDAAQAAKCAQDQGMFWEYHDELYANQQGENIGAFSVENLKKFALKLELNSDEFNQCLDSKKYEKTITEEVALGRTFGVKGTPATFIDDFFISGAQGASYFANRIEAALADK